MQLKKLKSKKHNTQFDWLMAWEAQKVFAETEAGKKRAEYLTELAISRIPKGDCVYCWSGGKDAIALQCICEKAGITTCALGSVGLRWEYPSFIDFVNKHKPAGLIIKDYDYTADFFNKNENLLFPVDYKDNYYWFVHYIQRTFKEFLKETGADYVILGHRRQDGNIVADGYMKQKAFPMYDFTHEDVFLLIAYNKKVLPYIYFYPNGFNLGTHPWTKRRGDDPLGELYEIDKNILLNNTEINKVRIFLENKKELV